MSFDGLFLHSLIIEMKQQLLGGRISKISQPFSDGIIFTIRSIGKNWNLFLSASPNNPRIQVTNQNFQNPVTAPNFLMSFRRYLNNGKIKDIKQIEADRVLYLEVESTNDFGDLVIFKVWLEIIGSKTNIVLTDSENKIIDVLKRGSIEDERSMLPGTLYETPANNKLNPFKNTPSEDPLDYQGFNKRDTHFAIEFANLNKFISGFNHPDATYLIEQEDFLAWDYGNGEKREFPTLFEMMDFHYTHTTTSVNENDKDKKELLRVVRTAIKRDLRKIDNLNSDTKNANNADVYKIYGEILTTYLNQVEANIGSIVLPNFYDNMKEINIPLDVKLNANQNAQNYFNKYSKLKKSTEFIEIQLENTNNDLIYLNQLEYQIDTAQNNDLQAIKDEMIANGLIKSKNSKKQKTIKSTPEKFLSSYGDVIEVGKNNLQNEQLSTKNANKKDIWLHVKDIPGSHVIIRNSNPSKETILEAANLAAFFSKAKNSSKVPVDYLETGKLNKPSGGKPGFVTFTGQTTILVDPDSELVEKLRTNLKKRDK